MQTIILGSITAYGLFYTIYKDLKKDDAIKININELSKTPSIETINVEIIKKSKHKKKL